MKYARFIVTLVLAMVAMMATTAQAARFNDKVLNRPYADMRRWHLGFSIGFHTQDLNFTHNGYVAENGESWAIEQPSFQPGFCVNGLFDLRLNDWFNIRFTPGLFYGSRDIHFREANSGQEEIQSLKSTYLVFPLDLKYSALRYHNVRPYVTAGIMPAIDLTRKTGENLRLNPSDFYLTVGFGLDVYFPYFKFIPDIKFCFGLMDVIDHKRPDMVDDPLGMRFTQSIKKATSQMVVFTFYFE